VDVTEGYLSSVVCC